MKGKVKLFVLYDPQQEQAIVDNETADFEGPSKEINESEIAEQNGVLLVGGVSNGS